jgi:hypothetical protein
LLLLKKEMPDQKTRETIAYRVEHKLQDNLLIVI